MEKCKREKEVRELNVWGEREIRELNVRKRERNRRDKSDREREVREL